jgi:ClpP class serine protease
LIALAADEIVMDENAVLGPVDPQLGQQPAASILKVLERKPIDQIDDNTIILADIAEKALRQVKSTVVELLGDKMPADQAERVATALSSGVWTHDYPITVDEARQLGLSISTDMPRGIYRLMALHPQTAQRRVGTDRQAIFVVRPEAGQAEARLDGSSGDLLHEAVIDPAQDNAGLQPDLL